MPAYYQDIAAQECAGVIGTPMPPLARRQRVAIGRGLPHRNGGGCHCIHGYRHFGAGHS